MRCPNCGFESEDNFCQICGIEIPEACESKEINKEENAEEALPAIVTIEQSARRKPKLKKILISALCILLGTAFVSAASIGIYAYLTKPDDKLFFHSVGQEINCGSFSITMTGTPQPTGELQKYETIYYVDAYDNYYYDEYSLFANGLDSDDVTSQKEESYQIIVNYPIEFTIKNNTGNDMEFSVPDLYPLMRNEFDYSSLEYYGEFTQNFDSDIVETNSKGNIEVTAYSETTLTKVISYYEYYSDTKYFPDSIMSQMKDENNLITDNKESNDTDSFSNLYGDLKERYRLDNIDDVSAPESIYMTCSFYNKDDRSSNYDWLKFYAEYPSSGDDTEQAQTE